MNTSKFSAFALPTTNISTGRASKPSSTPRARAPRARAARACSVSHMGPCKVRVF